MVSFWCVNCFKMTLEDPKGANWPPNYLCDHNISCLLFVIWCKMIFSLKIIIEILMLSISKNNFLTAAKYINSPLPYDIFDLLPSPLPLGHGGYPQYWIFSSERGRNMLVLWNLNARAGCGARCPPVSVLPHTSGRLASTVGQDAYFLFIFILLSDSWKTFQA